MHLFKFLFSISLSVLHVYVMHWTVRDPSVSIVLMIFLNLLSGCMKYALFPSAPVL